MGVSGKNRLLKNCPTAQQFAEFFETKISSAEGNCRRQCDSRTSASDRDIDHFQLCTARWRCQGGHRKIVNSSSKSCLLDPQPTNMLKKINVYLSYCLSSHNVYNASLQQGCLLSSLVSQLHAIVRTSITTEESRSGCIEPAQLCRPLSNLAFMAKVVGTLVCLQLVAFFECHELLSSVQPACRKKHSIQRLLSWRCLQTCYVQRIEAKSVYSAC